MALCQLHTCTAHDTEFLSVARFTVNESSHSETLKHHNSKPLLIDNHIKLYCNIDFGSIYHAEIEVNDFAVSSAVYQ